MTVDEAIERYGFEALHGISRAEFDARLLAAAVPLAAVAGLFEKDVTGPPALRLITSADGPDEGSLDGNEDEGTT